MSEQPIPITGFNPYEDAEPPEEERDLAREEIEKVEDAMLTTFNTGQGKFALGYLRSRTEGAPGFVAEMGLLNGIAWGFAREGQNSIIRHIDQLMHNASTRRT